MKMFITPSQLWDVQYLTTIYKALKHIQFTIRNDKENNQILP